MAQLPASFPTLQPWIRCLSQTAFLITGTRPGDCSFLSGGLQFPASRGIIQTSQPRPPMQLGGTPSSCYNKSPSVVPAHSFRVHPLWPCVASGVPSPGAVSMCV